MGALRALLVLAIGLASPAAADEPGTDFPTRADVERIMMEWMRCEVEDCGPPPRGAVVRNLRCMPDRGWEFERRTRVICVFSGRWIGEGYDGRVMDCAYLWRGESGGSWTFMASPDWDLCEGYEAELADAPIID